MITVREALTALALIVLICIVGWAVLAAAVWAVIQLLLFMGSVIVPTVTY